MYEVGWYFNKNDTTYPSRVIRSLWRVLKTHMYKTSALDGNICKVANTVYISQVVSIFHAFTDNYHWY